MWALLLKKLIEKNKKQTYAEMGEEEKNKINHRGKRTKEMIN